MGDQEWCEEYRNAIDNVLHLDDMVCVDPDLVLADILDALAPLRDADRQQARQEALTEAARLAEEMQGAPRPGAVDSFAQGWRAGLGAAHTVLSARAERPEVTP